MKIPCVRCGKPIDSPSTYCRDCARDMEQGNLEQSVAPAPKKKRRIFPILLIFLILLAGVFWYATPGNDIQQKISSLTHDVPSITIVADQIKETIQPDSPTTGEQDTPAVEEASQATTPPAAPPTAAEKEPTPATEPAAEQDTPPTQQEQTQPEAVQPEVAQSEQAPDAPSAPSAIDATEQAAPSQTMAPASQEAQTEPATQSEASDDTIEFGPASPEEFPSNTEQQEQPSVADAGEGTQEAATVEPIATEESTDQGKQPATEETTDEITEEDAAVAEEQPAADQEQEAEQAAVETTEEAAQEVVAEQEPTAEKTATEEEQPVTHDTGIWIFWMDKENADKTLAAHLQENGWVNASAKGKWPGHFNDKNIFYRHEDQTGLADLHKDLPSNDFFDYYYNNERIGQSVKRIFRENDNVNFVIILQ